MSYSKFLLSGNMWKERNLYCNSSNIKVPLSICNLERYRRIEGMKVKPNTFLPSILVGNK